MCAWVLFDVDFLDYVLVQMWQTWAIITSLYGQGYVDIIKYSLASFTAGGVYVIIIDNTPPDRGLYITYMLSTDITVNCKELSTYGNDFYIGFLRQYSTKEIKVHTFENTPISFSISSKAGYNYIGTTSASSPATVTIPSSFQVRDSGYEYRNLGLQITSLPTNSIAVIVIGYDDLSILTYVAHPYLEQLTTAYTYYGASTYTRGPSSQVLLISCQDNTTVTITPTQNISLPQNPQLSDSSYLNITAGDSHTVTLHEMQSLLIINSHFDLTGTKIVSNYPLTVISGHQCASIPSEYNHCDAISTQIPPTVNWGKRFLLPPLTSRTNGQRYKIIASQKNTIAEIKCGTKVTKTVVLSNDGDIYQFDTNSNEYCTVLTSNPSYVAEYGFGREYQNDGYGDPLLMTIPPLDQYIHSVTFSSFETIPKNYSSILVPNDQYFNQTYLYNGLTLTPTWTTIYYPNRSIAGYGYSTQFNGTVTISHSNPNGSIFVAVYGFVEYGGYGYAAGMKLNSINDLPEISFTKEKYYVGEGDGVIVIVLERYVEITWSVSVIIKILSSKVATASGKKLIYSGRMTVNFSKFFFFLLEGVDYISINEIVNFQSGETLKNITITILDDTYVERTEYFILEIESIEEVVTFSIREAVVAIQDNDSMIKIFVNVCTFSQCVYITGNLN